MDLSKAVSIELHVCAGRGDDKGVGGEGANHSVQNEPDNVQFLSVGQQFFEI